MSTLTIHDCVLAVAMDNAGIAPPVTLTIHDCILAVSVSNISLKAIPREFMAWILIGGSWKIVLMGYLKIGDEWVVTAPTLIA